MAKVPKTPRASVPGFSAIALPPTSRIAGAELRNIERHAALTNTNFSRINQSSAQAFGEAARIVERETKRHQTRQLNEGNAEMTRTFNELKLQYANRPDFETYPQEFDQAALAAQQQVLGTVGDADVQEVLRGTSTRSLQAMSLGMSLRAEEQSHVADKTAVDTNLAELVRGFGDAETPEEQQHLKAQAFASIEQAFDAGVYSERDEFLRRESLFADFDRLDKERASEARRVLREARAAADRKYTLSRRLKLATREERAEIESAQRATFEEGMNDNPVAMLEEITKEDSEIFGDMDPLVRAQLRARGIAKVKALNIEETSAEDRQLQGEMVALIRTDPLAAQAMLDSGEVAFKDPLLGPRMQASIDAKLAELKRAIVEQEKFSMAAVSAAAVTGIRVDARRTLAMMLDETNPTYAPLRATPAGQLQLERLIAQATKKIDEENKVLDVAKVAGLEERALNVSPDTVESLRVDIGEALASGTFGLHGAKAAATMITRMEANLAEQSLVLNANRKIDARIERDPGSTFNPKNKYNKAALNKRWAAVEEGLALAEQNGSTALRNKYEAEGIEMITRTGYPSDLAARMEATILSGGDTQALLQFTRIYMGVEGLAAGVNKKQFDDPTQMTMRLIAGQIEGGTASTTAIQIARDAVNQRFELTKERRSKFLEAMRTEDVDKFFTNEVEDTRGFGPFFEAPPPTDLMMGQWKSMLRAQYMLSGSWKESREEATSKMLATWGLTETGGAERWMRNPPEKVYEESGAPPRWMQNQLVENISGQFAVPFEELPFTMAGEFSRELLDQFRTEGVPADMIILEEDAASRFEEKTTYIVSVLNENGIPKMIFNPLTGERRSWHPDWMTSPDRVVVEALQAEEELRVEAVVSGAIDQHDRQNAVMAEKPEAKMAAGVSGRLEADAKQVQFHRPPTVWRAMVGVQDEADGLNRLEQLLRATQTQEQLDATINLSREQRGLEPVESFEGTMHWEGP